MLLREIAYISISIFFLWVADAMLWRIAELRPISGWNSNYSEAQALTAMQLAVTTKRPLILWGSCEFTNSATQPLTPYIFVPEALGVPTVAMGHGGMQFLATLGQMAAYYNELEGTRSVVLLGLEWFYGRTALASFLEFMPTPLLSKYYFESHVPKKIRNHIARYVSDHFSEIRSPSWTLRAIKTNFDSNAPPVAKILVNVPAWFIDYIPGKMLIRKGVYLRAASNVLFAIGSGANSPGGGSWRRVFSDFDAQSPDWKRMLRTALAFEQSRMKTNSLGIMDSWYLGNKESIRTMLPVPRPEAGEWSDMETLLELLNSRGVRALFVIEGFNKLVFDNWEEVEPLTKSIRSRLYEQKMAFVDVGEQRYQVGSHANGEGIASYSWVLISRGIYDYFVKSWAL